MLKSVLALFCLCTTSSDSYEILHTNCTNKIKIKSTSGGVEEVLFYIERGPMKMIFASKLTNRLLSSSTAIRSRANSFSDWAEKKSRKNVQVNITYTSRPGKSANWADVAVTRYSSYTVFPCKPFKFNGFDLI